jgi:hypothetical protein
MMSRKRNCAVEMSMTFTPSALQSRVINAIEPGSIQRIDSRSLGLVYAENINQYLKHCWKLGVPSSDLFVTSDLLQGKGMAQVIQNIWSLIRLAQAKSE